MPFTQDNKLLTIHTPLGPDALLLTELTGEEGISRIFSFELSLLSANPAISFDAIIGRQVTVAINLSDGNNRYLNGIVSSFSQGGEGGEEDTDTRLTSYRATMVPWFYVLTKAADCRIFQNLSSVEIVERIFKDQGFSDYRLELQASYEKREFCVQYRETAFNFVSRLLEDEGIFYFFEHQKDRHIMVLADSPAAHKPCSGGNAISCQSTYDAVREEDVITSFEMTRHLAPSKYSLGDYNFTIPRTDLSVQAETTEKISIGRRHIYDYPGSFRNRSGGESLVRARMEEEEAASVRISGTSDCRFFASGFHFTLKDHPRAHFNGKAYLLNRIAHTAAEGYGDDAGASYRNSFECLPHEIPFRPPRLTQTPVVQGPQTAVVVGPSGEEIYTDEHGRVKVQFHWDRGGKKNDNSSCWIRVSQFSAANGWGALCIPRVGQEVMVEFLEGDPDRPLVVGQLYNGLNLPPYPLPAHKTRTTFKSNSYPDGDGFNEIRFEDKKGGEQLFIHAQRQQDNRVNGDSLEWVGQDRHLIVESDRLERVSGDQHLTVAGDRNEKVDGSASLTVSADLQQKVGAKHAIEAGEEIHLKGAHRVVIESASQISLKVGGNFITIGPAGVNIVGAMVLINSGGAAAFGSGASPDLPKLPKEADVASSGSADERGVAKPTAVGPQATAIKTGAAEKKLICDT